MAKRTKTDPTGQAANRKRATSQLRRRLAQAERAVRTLFRAIPRTRRSEAPITNAGSIPVYDYQITAPELEALEQSIRQAVGSAFDVTEIRKPPNWWWQEPIERAYRGGTADEVVEFNRLVTDELVRTRTQRGLTTQRLEVGQVLQSAEYVRALNRVYVQNYSEIKGLAGATSDQVIGVVNRGIGAKKTPTEIADDIAGRFGVAKSKAARIASTEINKAYNGARLSATELAARTTGMRAGVLHLSALIPTTRNGHAARHGNAYTVAQERQWWDSGTNRINCHCSTRSVLIDAEGKVIDVELQEEIQAERKLFDAPPG